MSQIIDDDKTIIYDMSELEINDEKKSKPKVITKKTPIKLLPMQEEGIELEKHDVSEYITQFNEIITKYGLPNNIHQLRQWSSKVSSAETSLSKMEIELELLKSKVEILRKQKTPAMNAVLLYNVMKKMEKENKKLSQVLSSLETEGTEREETEREEEEKLL